MQNNRGEGNVRIKKFPIRGGREEKPVKKSLHEEKSQFTEWGKALEKEEIRQEKKPTIGQKKRWSTSPRTSAS